MTLIITLCDCVTSDKCASEFVDVSCVVHTVNKYVLQYSTFYSSVVKSV